MKPFFLDPQKPLNGCTTNCEDCPVQSQLHCHFRGRDLLRFLAIAFPPFILGGMGIGYINTWHLLIWIAIAFSYFGFIEIRVMCSHCPHYAEPGTKSLQCWANYGSPKLWKYRPGPMSQTEKFIFYAGLVIIAGYPLVFMIAYAEWVLLALFVVTVVFMGTLMARLMCANCMNFACPFNGVDDKTRKSFFDINSVVGQAWRDK